MTLQERDKRALKIMAVMLAGGLIWMFWPSADASKTVAQATAATPDVLEQQLERLRAKESQIPAKLGMMKDLQGQLNIRERGLIMADTLPQAQAILAGSVRQVARQEGFDFRNISFGQTAIYGGEYGQIVVQVSAECRIEQVVNFLADLTKRPELLATEDMRISSGNAQSKVLQFVVTISGLVPKRLVPEKRAGVL